MHRQRSRRRPRAPTVLPLAAAVAAGLVMTGCTGLYQRALPERPTRDARTVTGGELLVGAGEADITPDGLPYLAGFDPARRATGVHLPLKVRAVVMSLGGARFAVVGVDNLGLMLPDVEWIKGHLAGYRSGDVFIASSHTHAGPDAIGMWGFYFLTTGRDPREVARIRDGVVAAVRAAEAAARPARLVRGEARVPPAGLVRNSNRSGVFDRRLTVLQARALDGDAPLGTLLHLACHPETLRRGNTLLSADFVGPLCDGWREAGHGQAVFVNGALGAMVSPEPSGVEGCRAMGEALLRIGEAALAGAEPLAPVTEIEVARGDVYLPVRSPGFTAGRLTWVVDRPAYRDCLRSTVGDLRLGEGVEIAMVPGEIEPGLAARLRALCRRPDLLVFGLVDDEVGYLMAEQQARDPEFAYERLMSPAADSGERVLRALVGPPRPVPETVRARR